MPTQPLHHVSRLAFPVSDLSRISTFVFRIYALCPNTRNQPNSRTAGLSPAFPYPHFTKQTQSTAKPTIYELPIPARRETTNQKMRNEPNLRTGTACRGLIMRNEPNLPHAHHPPTQKNTKRTQFTPTVTLSHAKNAKRTQFPYRWHPAGFSTPYYAKRTQSTIPPPSRQLPHPPNPRNKPNCRPAAQLFTISYPLYTIY